MLRVTYIDFRGTAVPGQSGWYITDANGSMIDDAKPHATRAEALKTLATLYR